MNPTEDIESNHWARLEEKGVYLGLWSMLAIYRVLGRFGFSLFLYPVMAYFFVFGSSARSASLKYLNHIYAFPRGRAVLGAKPTWRQSFRHFLNFGDSILDKLLAWTEKIGLERVDFENLEVFEELESSGRGAVLIASHLGNAEVCRALGMRKRGLKINVMVHTKHAGNFNKLLREQSRESAVSIIETTEVGPETAILLHKRVERGEFIVIVGDRIPVAGSGRYSFASFLGERAPFPQGPYILGALLKCPVHLLFCLKEGGRFRVIFERFSEGIQLPRKGRAEALDALAARYAERLEQYCFRAPYQWFNFFDFWSQADTLSKDSEAAE